jgi:hypothetical protein
LQKIRIIRFDVNFRLMPVLAAKVPLAPRPPFRNHTGQVPETLCSPSALIGRSRQA